MKSVIAVGLIFLVGGIFAPEALKAALPTSRPAAAEGAWEFQCPENDFRPEALLDLRALNEKSAGEHGFIRLSPDGHSLVRGDGEPIRFWGVIANAHKFSAEQWRQQARWLANMGVNMVRHAVNLPSRQAGARPGDTNQEEMDVLWKMVAAMKAEGIYTAIIDYSVLENYDNVDMTQWGIPGYAANYQVDKKSPKPWCAIFFDPQLRQAYQARLKDLYLRPNPYTGIPLAQEPAVLWNQLQTEDSLLWYTVDQLQPESKRELGQQFGRWLAAKYGSPEKALAQWDQATIANGAGSLDDDLAQGVVGLYHIWDTTQAGAAHKGPFSAGQAKRLADQVEFLSRTMQNFNADMARFFHEELGSKQMILADNWRPADAMTMQDAERWSYLPGQVMAENHFFTGVHEGPDCGWRVQEGDLLAFKTALKPLDLPDPPSFVFKQVAGRASFITSTSWVYPNLYQSEGPFLFAAYGSLDGLSGVCWEGFSGQPEYDLKGIIPINKTTNYMLTWNCARPPLATSFPAAALILRRGYVRCGAPVVEEERKLTDLWERKLPRAMDHGSYAQTTAAMKEGAADPLAFFVGPVRVKYDGDSAQSRVADLAKYIDRKKQMVRSNTGEVTLDYATGLCRLDAPKAQGVCGFLNQAGEIALSTVTIKSANPYAAVLVVAMDDRSLAESRKILIQVNTTARPTGWKTAPADFTPKNTKEPVAGQRVLAIGAGPWLVADTQVMVVLKNGGLSKATLLDAGGNPAAPVAGKNENGFFTVTLPSNCIYLMVE